LAADPGNLLLFTGVIAMDIFLRLPIIGQLESASLMRQYIA